jgi:hypothetical protein
MKRFIFIALASIITISSCTAKKPKDYMIFSGKIANYNKKINKIYLFSQNDEYEIPINENGFFSDSLKIKTGYYEIDYNEKTATVYLNNTNDLKLFFSENNLIYNYYIIINNFEGKDAALNIYLQKKLKILSESASPQEEKEIDLLAENEYVAKYKALKIKLEKLLKSSKIKDELFLKIESKSIYYQYLKYLMIYEVFHKIAIKNPKFKVSKSFPFNKEMKKLDLNDIIAYENVPEYYDLLKNYCYSIGEKVCDEKDENSFYLAYFDNVNANITNEIIKNDLIYQAVSTCMMSKINEACYKKAMSHMTNEKYKSELKKMYEELKLAAAKVAKGKVSPKFKNYENYKGGTTSLDDFKGKYVFINVWAPC